MSGIPTISLSNRILPARGTICMRDSIVGIADVIGLPTRRGAPLVPSVVARATISSTAVITTLRSLRIPSLFPGTLATIGALRVPFTILFLEVLLPVFIYPSLVPRLLDRKSVV